MSVNSVNNSEILDMLMQVGEVGNELIYRFYNMYSMSTHARASDDMQWRDLRYNWGCMCRLGCGSAPGTRHWCRKYQGRGRCTCSSGMLCWMGSQSGRHTLVGTPRKDLQSIQGCTGKSQRSSAYCKLHWIRKVKDCTDQLAPPLVALEQWG